MAAFQYVQKMHIFDGKNFMKKQRLDEFLIAHEFVRDKNEAFIIVTEGRVSVEGHKAISPAQMVMPLGKIEVRPLSPYVGRAAYKLAGALDAFGLTSKGLICVDIGAATGGFTQVLLERGARKVYAIDTAKKGKLALKLREDPRVVVREETDVRHMEKLPELVSLITIDVSLISLRDILQHAKRLLESKGTVVALFKPQYETRDPRVLHKGVVSDARVRERMRDEFVAWVRAHGWQVMQIIESPIRGAKGNVEYLLHLTRQ